MVQWKDIEGYEGLYKISNFGDVLSVKNDKKYILKQRHTTDGYLDVTLYKHGKPSWCRVHRLVAQAFIPNPENKPQVNHIDGDKKNNNIDNLEWCTPIENTHHAIVTGLERLYGDDNPNAKIVIQYDLNGEYIKEYSCIKYASIATKISQTHISSVCTGKRKSAGGFIWKHKGGGVYANRCN